MTTQKKLLIYKILLFVFAFFIAFMPSTASRNKEVNSRVIVETLGIDGGEEISLTAQYVMPADSQGETSKDTVTVKGKTLNEAVEGLSTALGRRAELGHCSMVVVGSELKIEELGTLLTATDVTADVYLAAAKDKAEDAVNDITEFMKKTGATDAGFIAYSAKKGLLATNTLLGFLSDVHSASKSAYIPVVEMQKSYEGGQSGGGQSGEGGGQSGQGGGDSGGSGMRVETLALYNADGRAGIIQSESARGVAWVSAPIEKGAVCCDVEYDGKKIEGVCGRLLKKHASIKTDAKNGFATVKLKAYIEPNGDKFNMLYATNSPKAMQALVDGYKKKIKSELESAYADSVKLNCDPMFIGKTFFRYHPEYFDTEYDYNNITVNYDIEIAIK